MIQLEKRLTDNLGIHRCVVGISICPWEWEMHTYVSPSCCFFLHLPVGFVNFTSENCSSSKSRHVCLSWFFFLSLVCLCFVSCGYSTRDTVSYISPGWPQTCLEFLILLTPPPKSRTTGIPNSCSAGTKSRASCMLAKHSTN